MVVVAVVMTATVLWTASVVMGDMLTVPAVLAAIPAGSQSTEDELMGSLKH